MTIAVIIARGGSKRLPRKNVKSFCGLPLVAWSIIQAKTSFLIDEVFVSTDDDEIEAISRVYGAGVIRRPNWPDADKVAANRPFLHAVGILKEQYPLFDTLVTMLPTTPLVKPGDIDNGIMAFRKYGCDRLMPLIPMRETIVLKKIHQHVGRVTLFDKFYGYLHESNAWLVTTPEWYTSFNGELSDLDVDLNDMSNWGSWEWPFIPAEYWQYADVDTQEEFEFAEVVMEYFILKGRGQEVYRNYYTDHSSQTVGIDYSRYIGNSSQLEEAK